MNLTNSQPPPTRFDQRGTIYTIPMYVCMYVYGIWGRGEERDLRADRTK
jgi:hypothetical protein